MRTLSELAIIKMINHDLRPYPIIKYELKSPCWIMLEKYMKKDCQHHNYEFYYILGIVYENVRFDVEKCMFNAIPTDTDIPFTRYVKYDLL